MTDKTEAMDKLIAQDADLLEKTRPISNERDAGQPWLRTYDAHLKVECSAGQTAIDWVVRMALTLLLIGIAFKLSAN